MYESDYKISVKGLTNDKQCFIISIVAVRALVTIVLFLFFTPFFIFHLLSKVAEQHREIGAVLLYT